MFTRIVVTGLLITVSMPAIAAQWITYSAPCIACLWDSVLAARSTPAYAWGAGSRFRTRSLCCPGDSSTRRAGSPVSSNLQSSAHEACTGSKYDNDHHERSAARLSHETDLAHSACYNDVRPTRPPQVARIIFADNRLRWQPASQNTHAGAAASRVTERLESDPSESLLQPSCENTLAWHHAYVATRLFQQVGHHSLPTCLHRRILRGSSKGRNCKFRKSPSYRHYGHCTQRLRPVRHLQSRRGYISLPVP